VIVATVLGFPSVYAETNPEAKQQFACWVADRELKPDAAGNLICPPKENAPAEIDNIKSTPSASSSPSASPTPEITPTPEMYNIPVPATVQFDNPAIIQALNGKNTLPVESYPEIQDGSKSLNPDSYDKFYVVRFQMSDGSVGYGTAPNSYVITAHAANDVSMGRLGYSAGNVIQDQLLDRNSATGTWEIDPNATITVDGNQYAPKSVISVTKSDDKGSAYTNAVNTMAPGTIVWVTCDYKGPYKGGSLNYVIIVTTIVGQ